MNQSGSSKFRNTTINITIKNHCLLFIDALVFFMMLASFLIFEFLISSSFISSSGFSLASQTCLSRGNTHDYNDSYSTCRLEMLNNGDGQTERRRVIFSFFTPIATLTAPFQSEVYAVDDRLFKPNPLTNPILEQIRILEQAQADNIKYGGELAPGSPKGQETYAKLLVPILKIQNDLNEIDKLVRINDGKGLGEVLQILNKPQFDKIQFKKTFNAFGKVLLLCCCHCW